jgi:hypothetical protein
LRVARPWGTAGRLRALWLLVLLLLLVLLWLLEPWRLQLLLSFGQVLPVRASDGHIGCVQPGSRRGLRQAAGAEAMASVPAMAAPASLHARIRLAHHI